MQRESRIARHRIPSFANDEANRIDATALANVGVACNDAVHRIASSSPRKTTQVPARVEFVRSTNKFMREALTKSPSRR
jgi:hypothetical protein